MMSEDTERVGCLGNVSEDTKGSSVVPVDSYCERGLHTGDVVVFLNPLSGLKMAGPVTVLTFDQYGCRLVVSSPISADAGDAIYLSGEQTENSPPVV